jgi:Na+-driven multidrug efflux pump
MSGTLLANGINIVLNALFLLVFRWGVFGVALATGISRLFQLVWVFCASRRLVRPVPDAAPPGNGALLMKVIRIGLPAAMESCLYNLAITVVVSLLNGMDDTGTQATARTYAAQIANFSVCIGIALAQSNAILVGWRIGAGELDACDKGTRSVALLGIGLGVSIAGFFALMARPVLRIFTEDPEMIRLVSRLLLVDIALEIGRVTNLVFGDALKTSGDAIYPMVVAVVFAFVCAAAGTWFFGVRLGWLAFGAYVAMALDECVRAVFMFLRWRSGIWKSKKLS